MNKLEFGRKKGNRTPFSGIVTKVDKPSDGVPGGSWGKVVFPSKEMEKALHLLIGMPVNAEFDSGGFTGSSYLSYHDEDNIIGVFTEAWISGDDVRVKGHLFSETYPQEVRIIKSLAKQGDLGMSIEVEVEGIKEVDYEGETVLETYGLTPLGAAILFKDRAAFEKTKFAAARKGVEEMEDKLKEIMASLTEIKEKVEKLEAEAVKKEDVSDFITAEAIKDFITAEALDDLAKKESLDAYVKAEDIKEFVKSDDIKCFVKAEEMEEKLSELQKLPKSAPQLKFAQDVNQEEDVVTRLQKKMFA